MFFILWSYFTYNDGVIHNKGGERVIASIESSPKKFYFIIFGAIGLGCITVAHGIETIVKQKKAPWYSTLGKYHGAFEIVEIGVNPTLHI